MPSGVYERKFSLLRQKGVCFNSGRTHFKKGHIPWHKNKKMSDEFKEKIRISHLGYQPSENHRKNLSNSLMGHKGYWKDKVGKESFHYKGGITALHIMIRNLDETIIWRNSVFKRDNYICQNCDKCGSNLEAHHKREFNIILKEFLREYNQFSPIEDKETLVRLAIKYQPFWDINNGETLCKKCHNLTK